MNEKITKAIKKLYAILEPLNIQWILTGSTALAIRGIDVPAVDIDILTSQNDIEKIDQALSYDRIQKPDFSETDKYRSFYGIYKIDGIKIDVMAEFQYRQEDGEWSEPNQNHEVETVSYENMSLPLLSLEQELKEYENMGREDKASAIRKVLTMAKGLRIK